MTDAPAASAGHAAAPPVWDGDAMTQEEFMLRDTVLVLDRDDNVTGSESKKQAHVFSPEQPRGVLHRAFSVFLFDEESGEVLLQKRAASKITFPNVWTNTCCSHPLHGMAPPENDGPAAVADGSVPGAKHAAIRKLKHELGIPCEEVPHANFRFLTRMHYWAADTVTHGDDAPWGEHEIDYILFISVKGAKDGSGLTVKAHPDEVDDVWWIGPERLAEELAKEGGPLLWSPWFRLIARRWLLGEKGWWAEWKKICAGEAHRHDDWNSVHRFDPPKEHMGGGGRAGPWLGEIALGESKGVGDGSLKQGAYGKVKIHKEGKLSQLSHLDEVWAAATLLYIKPLTSNLHHPSITSAFDQENLKFCDDILCKVSRSFAAVIRQLPPPMLVDVMIFYLVLRALDTVEDDMTAFASNKVKIDHLSSFHKTALGDPNWSMDGVGEADERRLLQEFPKCHSIYAALSADSRRIITDITMRMAAGMAEFVGKDLGQGTANIKEYDRYCHFVAGLVGEGLSRLFASSGLEKASLAGELFLSDRMGLFLQKTNIIRDYLEDYVDGRAFWPQTVWKKYSKTGDLGYFKNQDSAPVRNAALGCLNELVTDALELAPDCLGYLSGLRCAEIYRFCAIPQVMAIATLEKCYGNTDVFTGVVKIRKGLSCKLILATSDREGVHATFSAMARAIAGRADPKDPSYARTVRACDAICELTVKSEETTNDHLMKITRVCNYIAPVLATASAMYLTGRKKSLTFEDGMFPKVYQTTDIVVLTVLFACLVYLVSFGLMGFVLADSTEQKLQPAAKVNQYGEKISSKQEKKFPA
mmetsp:Transcript_6541/g.13700  ORF Transcript_6541/g.13700 Transcript_6541/m.13700 type:complete len:812 (-) Transcript_6541:185-2620(-)|eukprot:CAMPEP_0194311228 /NCGR_PEP_ID=MMETSP0171-20130528/8215_1 /TAXON_ID=218684 /ORGANISM="Corethron pennatum, Strain L29A3" /LENGTH=811 /DNA_ID=CAMNT_0039065251 /DNA_START=104 /DNA_END=2539 /DNA_ORIENTATION=-